MWPSFTAIGRGTSENAWRKKKEINKEKKHHEHFISPPVTTYCLFTTYGRPKNIATCLADRERNVGYTKSQVDYISAIWEERPFSGVFRGHCTLENVPPFQLSTYATDSFRRKKKKKKNKNKNKKNSVLNMLVFDVIPTHFNPLQIQLDGPGIDSVINQCQNSGSLL